MLLQEANQRHGKSQILVFATWCYPKPYSYCTPTSAKYYDIYNWKMPLFMGLYSMEKFELNASILLRIKRDIYVYRPCACDVITPHAIVITTIESAHNCVCHVPVVHLQLHNAWRSTEPYKPFSHNEKKKPTFLERFSQCLRNITKWASCERTPMFELVLHSLRDFLKHWDFVGGPDTPTLHMPKYCSV